MKIVVASGKGGTGKTSLAVCLVLCAGGAQLLDCDVEEPNAHLLLNPERITEEDVMLLVPKINEEKCDFCGECARFCQFKALFIAGETALVFPQLCHSCGGCLLVCPRDAITEEPRRIGKILQGKSGDIDLVYGELDVGEPMAVPLISAVKRKARSSGTIILDAPPGTACPLAETVGGADFCILVTEPTPFGLHDLEIAVEVVKQIGVSCGVVVNFAGTGDRGVYDFCEAKKLPILMEIPFDREIAELYSQGTPFVKEMPAWSIRFSKLVEELEALV